MGRPPRPDAPPRRVVDIARREELRAQAGHVFAQMGFAHAKMRDIADATGILAGSIYHHFRSKDEILLELMQNFHDDILRDLHAIIDVEGRPVDQLTLMIKLSVRYILERPDESRIINQDFQYLQATPEFSGVVEKARAASKIWLDVLRRGVHAGELRDDMNIEIAYATLMGSIFSTLRWYRPTGKVRPEEFSAQLTSQLLDGLRKNG
ncbi:MAG TPA: TetR/AcrR family transcriptional regulator [Pseudonocardia sp.]|jgi:AcrR family transcriptional regulator|nr:TetR/AcrR family transcriptional regulator [Pseudonocardia sp.]